MINTCFRKFFVSKPKAVYRRFVSEVALAEPVKLAYVSYESTDTSQPSTSTSEEAPPLLIMHGLFGSKANWNTLCKIYHEKCQPRRKVIAVDARNHGDSPHSEHNTYAHLAMDIKHLLDEELRVDKLALLGHSMGGRAVMKFALQFPELVDCLLVADISPVQNSAKLVSQMPPLFLALKSIQMPHNVPLSKARFMVDQQLLKFCSDHALRSFLLTNLVQRGSNGAYMWRVNLDALISNFNAISTFPSTHGVQYKGRALFIGGTQSDYLRHTDEPAILKIFPNAQFQYIDGAGHWLHAEKPDIFLKLTMGFLNECATNNVSLNMAEPKA